MKMMQSLCISTNELSWSWHHILSWLYIFPNVFCGVCWVLLRVGAEPDKRFENELFKLRDQNRSKKPQNFSAKRPSERKYTFEM